jgi:hypothetical protein
MSESTDLDHDRRPADLVTLHRELEKLAARMRPVSKLNSDRAPSVREPVLVVRGK